MGAGDAGVRRGGGVVIWGADEPMALDLVPWQVELRLLVAVAAVAALAMLASLVVIAAVNTLLLTGCYLAWAVTR